MAYYRTLKSGERRLIYTAKDNEKSRQRASIAPRYYQKNRHRRTFKQRKAREYIAFLYRYYNGLEELHEEKERLETSLARERNRLHWTLIQHHTHTYQPGARVSGNPEECRYWINDLENDLRRINWLLAATNRF